MSKDEFYDEEEMAGILRIKKSTLQKNRSLGKRHPPFIKLGGIVLYPRKQFQEWMQSQCLHVEIKTR